MASAYLSRCHKNINEVTGKAQSTAFQRQRRDEETYRIRPNFCTMCLGFSKILGKIVYLPILRVHFKKKRSQRTYQIMLMRCFAGNFFSDFLTIKAYVVRTHLNCINKLMQFKLVPRTYQYAFIKK